MFNNFEDYKRRIEFYKTIRFAQIEAWSTEKLPIEKYENLNYVDIFHDLFKDGDVDDVKKTVQFIREKSQARLFCSDNLTVMAAYISLFLKEGFAVVIFFSSR